VQSVSLGVIVLTLWLRHLGIYISATDVRKGPIRLINPGKSTLLGHFCQFSVLSLDVPCTVLIYNAWFVSFKCMCWFWLRAYGAIGLRLYPAMRRMRSFIKWLVGEWLFV